MGVFEAFMGVMAISGANKQRGAGRRARNAAEENAQAIESETAENIGQMRKTQRQTLGMSKAIIASSGIRFDARKINRLRFSEGGTKTERVKTGTYTDYSGEDADTYEDQQVEQGYGEQTQGDIEGSSAFQYLREMRRNFASDIGYMGKAGRSRSRVTRMGGQVAQAQANASATQGYLSALGSFNKAFSGGGNKKTTTKTTKATSNFRWID